MRLTFIVLGIIVVLIATVVMLMGFLQLSGFTDILTPVTIVGESMNSVSTVLSGVAPWIPWGLILPIVGLLILVLIISSLTKRFSRDTCITDFENYHATVILPDETGDEIAEAFFGKLSVPTSAGGGFEIFYDPIQIEHLDDLLAYMKRIYEDTKNETYIESIHKIETVLKEKSSLVTVKGRRVDYVEASRKVYAPQVETVLAIIRFHHDLSEEEKKRRLKDFDSLFHPPFIKRKTRALIVTLNRVKDKTSQLVVTMIGAASAMVPGGKGAADELTKQVKMQPASYEGLLENSLGKVVNVEITDHLEQKSIQHAVLKEYTAKFITLFQAQYPLKKTIFLNPKDVEKGYEVGYTTVDLHGKLLEKPDLKITYPSKDQIEITNTTDKNMKIFNEAASINLPPGKEIKIKVANKIDYEIEADADIVISRKRSRIPGLGEPVFI